MLPHFTLSTVRDSPSLRTAVYNSVPGCTLTNTPVPSSLTCLSLLCRLHNRIDVSSPLHNSVIDSQSWQPPVFGCARVFKGKSLYTSNSRSLPVYVNSLGTIEYDISWPLLLSLLDVRCQPLIDLPPLPVPRLDSPQSNSLPSFYHHVLPTSAIGSVGVFETVRFALLWDDKVGVYCRQLSPVWAVRFRKLSPV